MSVDKNKRESMAQVQKDIEAKLGVDGDKELYFVMMTQGDKIASYVNATDEFIQEILYAISQRYPDIFADLVLKLTLLKFQEITNMPAECEREKMN